MQTLACNKYLIISTYLTFILAWNLKSLPEPQSSACLAHELNEIEDVRLCDPDNTLPYPHSSYFIMCFEYVVYLSCFQEHEEIRGGT